MLEATRGRVGFTRPLHDASALLAPRFRVSRRIDRALHHPHVNAAASVSGSSAGLQGSAFPSSGLAHGQPEVASALEPVELTWPWKWGSNIRYFKAGSSGGPPVLLLHGFGVGAWHYERNISELAKAGYQVYAVDLLGQGSSWPDSSLTSSIDESEQGSMEGHEHGPLCYSIDTWTEQLSSFVREVIRAPAWVVGNSLGGFLSVSVACKHPDLVQGLVLLNSTPFWSFRPPQAQPQGVWGLLNFSGEVPVPMSLKRMIKDLWWDKLRSRDTVTSMLSLVYAHKPAVEGDERLVTRIIEATEQPGALDAFASIVLSPKSELDFDSMLRSLSCPVSLVYGRQDPWVVPVWGQRATYVLSKVGKPPAMYLELDGAGHCPHHEAPEASNTAIKACIDHMSKVRSSLSSQSLDGEAAVGDGDGQGVSLQPPIPVGARVPIAEAGGRQVVVEHVDGRPRIVPEYLAQAVWRLVDSFGPGASLPGQAVGASANHQEN